MLLNVLMLFIVSAMDGVTTYSQKKYSARTIGNGLAKPLFVMLASLLSLIPYAIISKGMLIPDGTLLLYSASYAVALIAITVIKLIAYNRMNLILLNVLLKGSTVLTWVFGIVLFKESFKLTGLIAQFLIITAIILPLILTDKQNRKASVLSYVLGLALMVLLTASTVIVKKYCMIPTVDTGSMGAFYFYVNVFASVMPLIMVIRAARTLESGKGAGSELKAIAPVNYLFIVINCVLGAPSTIISTNVMQAMPLVDYTILATCIGTVVLFLNSRIVFREKGSNAEVVSLLLTVCATIVNLF